MWIPSLVLVVRVVAAQNRIRSDSAILQRHLAVSSFLSDDHYPKWFVTSAQIEALSDVAHRPFEKHVAGVSGSSAGFVVGTHELALAEKVALHVPPELCESASSPPEIDVDWWRSRHEPSLPIPTACPGVKWGKGRETPRQSSDSRHLRRWFTPRLV
jgi:hypothetical protein